MDSSPKEKLDRQCNLVSKGSSMEELGINWSSIYHSCTRTQKQAMMVYCSDIDNELGKQFIWFKGRAIRGRND